MQTRLQQFRCTFADDSDDGHLLWNGVQGHHWMSSSLTMTDGGVHSVADHNTERHRAEEHVREGTDFQSLRLKILKSSWLTQRPVVGWTNSKGGDGMVPRNDAPQTTCRRETMVHASLVHSEHGDDGA